MLDNAQQALESTTKAVTSGAKTAATGIADGAMTAASGIADGFKGSSVGASNDIADEAWAGPRSNVTLSPGLVPCITGHCLPSSRARGMRNLPRYAGE